MLRLRVVMVLAVLWEEVLLAQFSPGELSRAHQNLEGMGNCSKCHEVGKEISGLKCLDCHAEITTAIRSGRGFHSSVSSQQCVACHKEHHGREAQMTLFDKNTFDHAKTGFPRTGKHAAIQCKDCHTTKFIGSAEVAKIINSAGRESYLGLDNTCVSCHEDRHAGKVGTECQTCHTTTAWSPASNFDHNRTRFVLTGKHAAVQCNKCHTEIGAAEKGKPLLHTTKGFADCTPCHASPHGEKFAMQTCNSCHTTEGFKTVAAQKFDHNLTSFKLIGRHAVLQCQQCHKERGKGGFVTTYRMPHSRCTDCHADYHRGVFEKKYGNDCLKCHTQDAFVPSTFTLVAHMRTRFELKGAHAATLCIKCHGGTTQGQKRFAFANLKCETCHMDQHGGQFAKVMGDASCGTCHTTNEWRPSTFDHSSTSFSLAGKHAQVECGSCHKPQRVGGVTVVQYKGVKTSCESCHQEVHEGQFAVNGATNCTVCHSPRGWKMLVFDHNSQSAFALTGAHARAQCEACHRQETIGNRVFVRYKPTPVKCEACHKER
jgi:hypothetical protein